MHSHQERRALHPPFRYSEACNDHIASLLVQRALVENGSPTITLRTVSLLQGTCGNGRLSVLLAEESKGSRENVQRQPAQVWDRGLSTSTLLTPADALHVEISHQATHVPSKRPSNEVPIKDSQDPPEGNLWWPSFVNRKKPLTAAEQGQLLAIASNRASLPERKDLKAKTFSAAKGTTSTGYQYVGSNAKPSSPATDPLHKIALAEFGPRVAR